MRAPARTIGDGDGASPRARGRGCESQKQVATGGRLQGGTAAIIGDGKVPARSNAGERDGLRPGVAEVSPLSLGRSGSGYLAAEIHRGGNEDERLAGCQPVAGKIGAV